MRKNKIRSQAALVENTSKEYWESVLRDEGLSMEAGIHRFRDRAGALRYRLSFVGDSSTVDALYEMRMGENGKVKPKGARPDMEGGGEGRS